MEFLPKAFEALKSFNQFIIYVLIPSASRPGKLDKIPLDHRTKFAANAHDPNIWMTAKEAITTAKSCGPEYGVGFVFTEKDPFWFLDIDNCLEPCGTKWNDIANSLVTYFNGAACEISASKRGLHIIGSGMSPPHTTKCAAHNLEFYTSGRFVALTGTGAQGDAGIDFTPALPQLVQTYFTSATPTVKQDWTNTPCAIWNGPTNDDELIERALRSQSGGAAFGNKAAFRDLWNRNEEVLAVAYPDAERSIGYNESSADAALAQHLAFWTGNDCERIRGLMIRSSLRREKWEREDYLPRTILGACGRQKEWLSDRPPEPTVSLVKVQDESLRPALVQGATFLSIEQQRDIFTGAVYVTDEHQALIPGGYMLNADRFRAVYGGYTHPMDNRNEKTTQNAWQAFTESQAIRSVRADSTCFRPDLRPAEILVRDGQRLVNTYWPVPTERKKGDIMPFLQHIAKLCPEKEDQVILLAYMAALIQHKGVKFQWTPVIQGVEGNGKTLLTRCVAFAISTRYSHFPKAAEIASRFNDWLYRQIFIAIEDIYVPDSRLEVVEALKPMITNERLEVEAKGGVKKTRDICANFLINTNHKDGLRIKDNARRFAPFYTAQQSVSDLRRDGMLGDYFPNLYRWLGKDGYAIVCEFLHTYEIPDEYNPALGHRAPRTSSTVEAVNQGLGNVEQEILESVSQGLPGFKGGWISSTALDRLLEKLNATRRIPQNRRRDLMRDLGYEWHPKLSDGRTNRIVLPDGNKPRLYIKTDHADRNLESVALITEAYEKAQK